MFSSNDKARLRELAKAYAELAADEINTARIQRIRDMHNLKPVRPPVWIDELPWHEMDVNGELKPKCESEDARRMEVSFLRTLFRWKYFQADMVVENLFPVYKSYTQTEIGARIVEDVLSIDDSNHIVSHHYEDHLDTDEAIDALKPPVIRAKPDEDQKNLAEAQELFGDILPVKLRGYGIYYAPWDEISMLRGVENCMIDMIERPDFMHRTIERFTQIGLSRYAQMESEGLLDFNIGSLHCTPPYSDDTPAKDYDGGKVRLKDVWFRGMAQMFSSISPEMHEEFDLQYMRRLMDKCAISYYGCCEPLDRVIPMLRKIPNMRKMGVSPWSNVRDCAEQIGGDYVFARKPNPAHVAVGLNAEVVEKEIVETIEACRENGCPYEFVLKDISTVGYRPQSIFEWTDTVMRTIDRYY